MSSTVKLGAVLAVSLFVTACASVPTNGQDREMRQQAARMLHRLQLSAEDTSWMALQTIAVRGVNVCLDIAAEKLDDGVSPANVIAHTAAGVCSEYFDVAEFTMREGMVTGGTAPARYDRVWLDVASDAVVRWRAAAR